MKFNENDVRSMVLSHPLQMAGGSYEENDSQQGRCIFIENSKVY